MDRREAIEAALKNQNDAIAWQIIAEGMKDKYYGLRSYTISKLDLSKEKIKSGAENTLNTTALHDPYRVVKAAAIAKLGDYKETKYNELFTASLKDSSYSVAGNSLDALSKIDTAAAFNEAKRLSAFPSKGKLASAISKTLIKYGDESASDVVLHNFESLPVSQEKFDQLQALSQFLVKVKSFETFKRGVDDIIGFENQIPESFRGQLSSFIHTLLRNIESAKKAQGQTDLANYIDSKLPKEDKKGF
jgi:aminopeptidase N